MRGRRVEETTLPPPFTPQASLAKWRGGTRKERGVSHGAPLGDKQTDPIFRKMVPGRFIQEEIAKLDEQYIHDLWDGNNGWHISLPRAVEVGTDRGRS